jgi:DNA replication protein DnaC
MDELQETLANLIKQKGISAASLSYSKKTPEEILQMEVSWANDTVGNLTGYDCPLCKNRGYIYVIQGTYKVAQECSCMVQRRAMRRIERSGLKDLMDRYTIEKYQTPVSWQQKAKAMAIGFVSNPSGAWFGAFGAVGAGKTHICTAICIELLSCGQDVSYMLWKDEARKLKALVNDPEKYERLIAPLQTVKVLYIDDFWKTKKDENTGRYEQPSQADINLAFEILNARYNDTKLITIISSERVIQDLIDIDEAVGSRIMERTKGFCLSLTGDDKNWRLRP